MHSNTALTLSETYDHLRQRSDNYHDQLIPVRDIEFCNTKTIRIAGEDHQLTSVASKALASRLSVPHGYMIQIPEYLQQINYNYGLQRQSSKKLFVRFDGEKVRGVFSKRYVPIDHATIVENLLHSGVNPERKVELKMDDGMMQLTLGDPQQTFALQGDDYHVPGISIINSEIGLASFSIAAFILRLVCTNGLIVKDRGNATAYRHVSQKALDRLPQILSQAYSNIPAQKQRLTIAMDNRVTDPTQSLGFIGRQYGLDKEQRDAVDWAFAYEGGHTMFHIIQTLTKAAQYPKLTTEQSAQLQNVGGQVLSMVKPLQLMAA